MCAACVRFACSPPALAQSDLTRALSLLSGDKMARQRVRLRMYEFWSRLVDAGRVQQGMMLAWDHAGKGRVMAGFRAFAHQRRPPVLLPQVERALRQRPHFRWWAKLVRFRAMLQLSLPVVRRRRLVVGVRAFVRHHGRKRPPLAVSSHVQLHHWRQAGCFVRWCAALATFVRVQCWPVCLSTMMPSICYACHGAQLSSPNAPHTSDPIMGPAPLHDGSCVSQGSALSGKRCEVAGRYVCSTRGCDLGCPPLEDGRAAHSESL